MRNRKWIVILFLAAAALAALSYRVRVSLSCGPFFPTAYFTYSLHPDFPLDPYARGQLGVVPGSYAKSYLYVAYRYLSGGKFDEEEQKALLSLWHDRLANVSFGAPETAGPRANPWPQQWIEARKKVPGATPIESLEVFRQFGANYQQFINCTDDGFRTAIATLDQRIGQFGSNSPEVKDWLGAQDQVFANCTGRVPEHRVANQPLALEKIIPPPLQPGAPPSARADREYQIAAAYFYGAEYDEAGRRFQAIAQDSGSPWRQVAWLLAVRCQIRKATLSTDDEKYDKTPLVQAATQLRQILNDRSLAEVHPSTQRLLQFIEYRVDPVETERRLASRLMQDHIGGTLKQDLWDYTMLMDTAPPGDDAANGKTAQPGKSPAASGNEEGNDLTDWIDTFGNVTPAATDHAIERWRRTKSLAWLAAALGKLRAGSDVVPAFRKKTGTEGGLTTVAASKIVRPPNPALPELLKAAESVEPNSPGFATVNYHRLRLMYEANQSDAVRVQLDKLLAGHGTAFPPSSLNLFLALRMRVASNLEDLLRYAQRVPATISYDTEGLELPDDLGGGADAAERLKSKAPRFDADVTAILNQMLPLDLMAQAAESKVLTNDLRRQLAMATWVRAVLLGNAAVAARMVPVVETLEPSVKDLMETYRGEKSPEAAKFAAEYLMLKFPGARPLVDPGAGRTTAFNKIDDFRDNWWCLTPPGPGEDSTATGDDSPTTRAQRMFPQGGPAAPAFLNQEQRAQGQKDWGALQAIGVAPNFLAKEVVEWGKQHSNDPREAEALYLAVRATRYGCTDKRTGTFSKAAFQLLHTQYPNTQWASKTKYWWR